MLGNVHAAHDLEARDDGALQFGWDRKHAAQKTVDTHTHNHFAVLRLQVDIARALGNARSMRLLRDKVGADEHIAQALLCLLLHFKRFSSCSFVMTPDETRRSPKRMYAIFIHLHLLSADVC